MEQGTIRPETETQLRTVTHIEEWLTVNIARELELDPDKIDVHQPLSRYGLDSLAAVGLSGELEVWLGRELPPDLLTSLPTIEALAHSLADRSDIRGASTRTTPTETSRGGVDYTELDYRQWSTSQLFVQKALAFVVRMLFRLHVEGLAHFRSEDAYILAANHLHVFDAPLVFCFLPRPTVAFVSEHMRAVPGVNWFLKKMGNTIYVARGEGDQEAIGSALAVLRSGGVLAMAPEGKISRTGGLLRGHPGVVHLATQSGVPIVPLVIYGQERAFRHWVRLRRVPVRVRIGPGIQFPQGKATAKQLDAHRDTVMFALARMLPPEYRGAYRDSKSLAPPLERLSEE